VQISDAPRISPSYVEAKRNFDLTQAMMKNKMVEQAGK
jgi:hypothetical protein